MEVAYRGASSSQPVAHRLRSLSALTAMIQLRPSERRYLVLLPDRREIKVFHDPHIGLRFIERDDDFPAVGAHVTR